MLHKNMHIGCNHAAFSSIIARKVQKMLVRKFPISNQLALGRDTLYDQNRP